MDEYAFEIHIRDVIGNWVLKDATKTVLGYTEVDATEKAGRLADDRYRNWRILNVRLVKKFTNPDGEI